jgi:hypothetical protein
VLNAHCKPSVFALHPTFTMEGMAFTSAERAEAKKAHEAVAEILAGSVQGGSEATPAERAAAEKRVRPYIAPAGWRCYIIERDQRVRALNQRAANLAHLLGFSKKEEAALLRFNAMEARGNATGRRAQRRFDAQRLEDENARRAGEGLPPLTSVLELSLIEIRRAQRKVLARLSQPNYEFVEEANALLGLLVSHEIAAENLIEALELVARLRAQQAQHEAA